MTGWVLQDEDELMPEWLKENISSTCQYCKHPMLNYYNNDRCTNRRCTNPNCSGLLAARADFALKQLNVKGIGFETCLDYVRAGSLTDNVSILKYLQNKPTVSIGTYLRIHCFAGVDSELDKLCKENDIFTLDELFAYNGKLKPLFEENKQRLIDNSSLVNFVKKPDGYAQETIRTLTVMITGTPKGYASKEHFLATLDAVLNGKIKIIHQATKKQTGVDFLIAEEDSKTVGKRDAAIRGGIPIVTSEEFILYLAQLINKYNSEKS